MVVYNVSRISRDMTSFLNDIGFILAKCGVTLRSPQEVIDESPTGRFMLNIALSVHQLDNDIKSKTVKDDMALLASYGWWMSQAPIGLKLKSIVTGEYTNDGKPTKIKDFDGLIDIDTYNKNQRILSGKRAPLVPSNSELYPLRKLLICSKCGTLIRSSAPRSSSGKRSPRYHCTTKGHSSVPIEEMHQLFVDFLEEITPNEGTIKLFKEIVKRTAAKKLGDTTRELAQHREAISDIDKKLVEAVDAMLDGKITIDDKNRYSEALEQKRQDLRREIDKLERNQGLNEATIDYVCIFMTKPAKLWKDADLETRQAFQKMLFPNGLHFDIKDKIFGTDDLSPLFSVINNKKEPDSGSDCEMVTLVETKWNDLVSDIYRIKSIIPVIYLSSQIL